jgi:hypothetical protein
MLPSKSIFQSKTFWLNVAGVALWALDKFAGIHVAPIDPIAGVAAANVVNRFFTNRAVHLV